MIGMEARWGAAGLTASSAMCGWVEFLLLRRTLSRRIGAVRLPNGYPTRLWTSAAMAAAVAWAVKLALPSDPPLLVGLLTLGTYGVGYVGFTLAFGLAEARAILRRLR